MLIHYTACPICQAQSLPIVLRATDHTVSKEVFPIAQCNECTLRFTQDVPDARSIDPYYRSEDYISHSNTSKGIINRLYQYARKRTLVKKRRLIQEATGLQRGTLLDVGSGVGSFVNEMKQAGWDVTGLEPDAGARKVAADTYQLQLDDIDRFYQLPPASFDAITLWHVLEHVHDLQKYVAQLRMLLKPSGKLFIAVPNYTSVDANVYQSAWAAYDVPRHLYHFSPSSLAQLMKQQQLEVVKYKPMWYDSFYISLLSSRYKNEKTNWVRAALTGLRSNLAALFDTKKCSSVIYIIQQR